MKVDNELRILVDVLLNSTRLRRKKVFSKFSRSSVRTVTAPFGPPIILNPDFVVHRYNHNISIHAN